MSMQYKTDRQRLEMERAAPALAETLQWIQKYSVEKFAYDIVITCLARTPEEQALIYPDKKPTPYTSHYPDPDGTIRAADLRSRIYTPAQIEKMVADINMQFPRTDGKPTALYHSVGSGYHLHVQVPAPEPKKTA